MSAAPYRPTRRRTQYPRVFEPGQVVKIQREVSSPWEPAIYVRKILSWRGWHTIETPQGTGSYINTMSGMPTTGDDPQCVLTHTFSVPTRRIRHG